MATTVLYRKSSGEVLKISPHGQNFPHINVTYFGQLTDPSFPDGIQNRSLVDGVIGPARELGYQKIAIPSASEVRNATQQEIDGFEALKVEDDNILDADGASSFLSVHPRFRKILKAMLKAIVINQMVGNTNVKINEMIDQWNDYKTAVAGIANLNDFKTAVANLPDIQANLTEVLTLTQIRDSVLSEVDKDD